MIEPILEAPTLRKLHKVIKEPAKRTQLSTIRYDNPIVDALIIRKYGFKKAIIDSIVDIVMVYSVVTTLFFVAFETPDTTMDYIDSICQFILIGKFLSKFFTETTYNGKVARKFGPIAAKYAQVWLWFDLIALIPFNRFGYEMVGYYCRMSRLLKLSRILNFFDNSGIGVFINIFAGTRHMSIPEKKRFDELGAMLEILLLLCFSSYFLACFWYWYSHQVEDDGDFFNDYFDKMDKTSMGRKMLTVWYFIITTLTTVGYGDLFPVSTNEYAVMIIILLLGVAFFAYIIGVINEKVSDIKSDEDEDKCMAELNQWLDMLAAQVCKIPPKMKG